MLTAIAAFVAAAAVAVSLVIVSFVPIGVSIGAHDANTTAVSILFDTECLALLAEQIGHLKAVVAVGSVSLCAVALCAVVAYRFAYRARWALAYHDCICMIDANNRFVHAFAQRIAGETVLRQNATNFADVRPLLVEEVVREAVRDVAATLPDDGE